MIITILEQLDGIIRITGILLEILTLVCSALTYPSDKRDQSLVQMCILHTFEQYHSHSRIWLYF